MPELVVGIGGASAGLPGTDVVLPIRPEHPSAHGAMRLRLRLEDDVIVAAEPEIGYLHRGAEKLFEVRDYRALTMLADRHDWLSAFGSELAVVLTVESMLGIEVPERAVWLRTLLAELNRAASHLLFLGAHPAIGVDSGAFAAREALLGVLESATGGRMHFMANRVGGLAADVLGGWTDETTAVITSVRSLVANLTSFVRSDSSARGIGVLPAQLVDPYGLSGALARASGADFDVRRDEPYLAYGELSGTLRVPIRTAGDAGARFEVLAEQTTVALDLADACLRRLTRLRGPVNVRLPKNLRVPEGEAYGWTENPLGINGYFIVSRGERAPWRCKLRTASFNNLQVLGTILPGHRVADLVTVLASMFFVVGDTDR